MDITFLGQAGLFIQTKHGSILCDPWFNPAYFASWFPFPDNSALDISRLEKPTYLYVSHLHYDHFDPQFLKEHVWKEATVILPDYPIDLLERALRNLGFTKFIYTKKAQLVTVDGLTFTIMSMAAPVDGPLGDSGLIIDDGETRIYDQNDSRPIDMETLVQLGPYDAHFLQFSGAIWYPMVYQFPEKMLHALGRKKRENEMARALRYSKDLGATFIIPSAGPPCFLDDHLFNFNDFDRDPANTFPDQTVFLAYMQEQGYDNGRLMIPGAVATITKGACSIQHPLPAAEVQSIFTHKREYLEAYRARKKPQIDSILASLPRGQVDILASLKTWFEPLLEQANLTAVGINGKILLDLGDPQIVLDFHQRKVYAWNGEEWNYYFRIDAPLIEACIQRRAEDWINEFFLSCRFEAQRIGPYNEYVYSFFKCLTPERLQYCEGYYAERSAVQQLWEVDGYRIQRRCPHLKADLTRFAKIEDGVLTCTMHGWQFDIATGRCLTSAGHRLYSEPIEKETPAAETNPAQQKAQIAEANSHTGHTDPVRKRCDHCWYVPSELPEISKS